MILLDLPDDLVEQRVLSRRLCSRCGLDYNLISSRPAVPDVCDVCGDRPGLPGRRHRRRPRARLRDYHAKTRPVLELFRAKEVVLEVDARQPAADVQSEIRKRWASHRRHPDPTSAGCPRSSCSWVDLVEGHDKG